MSIIMKYEYNMSRMPHVGEKTPVEHALRACDKACRCFSIGCRHESVITMLNAKAAVAEAGAGAPRQ